MGQEYEEIKDKVTGLHLGFKDVNKFDLFYDKGVYELAYVAHDSCRSDDVINLEEIMDVEEKKTWESSIIVVLTKLNGELRTPKLLRFTQDSNTKMWSLTRENEIVSLETATSVRPYNCFILPNKYILLILG